VHTAQTFEAPELGVTFTYWTPTQKHMGRREAGQKAVLQTVPASQVREQDIHRSSHCRSLRKEVMQVTANAKCRKIVVASLARPTVEKRRSLNSDARPSTESILKKAALPVSSTASDEVSEEEAIQRARDGDKAMFEYLYRLHSRRVYAVCLRMVRDTTEAEDLTQEAFLLLFRKIHTFRGESAFSTWLHRLAVNLVLMHLRKKSLPAVSIEATSDPEDQTGSPSIDIGTPDLSLEGSIDRINLERCIKRLPAGYRTIFVLHDVQGYKHHEIAEILGRSVGDSKSQLHKARSRLRELLHETSARQGARCAPCRR
jgi:RNA polymerase sigma-70 factor (ECF subfamily)